MQPIRCCAAFACLTRIKAEANKITLEETYKVQYFWVQIFLMVLELRAQGTILNSLVGDISMYFRESQRI